MAGETSMSTLLVENIRHEDAPNNSLVLKNDGVITVANKNTYAGTQAESGHIRANVSSTASNQAGLILGAGAENDFNHSIFMRLGNDDVIDTMDFHEYSQFRFYTGGAITAQQLRLKIDSSGNIGIGTDSPRNKLDVNLNTNRSFNVRVSNEGSVAGTGLASIDPVSGNLRDMVVEGEEVHLATGSSSGDTSNLRLSAYAAGGVKLHTNLEIEGGLEFVDGSGGYIDFGMDQRTGPVTGINGAYIWSGSGASGDWLAGTLVLQSRANQNRNIEFVTGSTPEKRLTVYGSGNTHVHNDLLIGGNGDKVWPVVNVQRYHMGSGNSTTISSTQSYTNVGNSISYTPRAAGNLLVIEHGVQTWYGSTSNGTGDALIRFLVNGAVVWENNRARGNFDADEQRSHHYLRSQFLYTTTGTTAITIQLQGSTSGDVPGGFNFYHTTGDANQYIITEYAQ